VKEADREGMRTLYDGMGFEVIRESVVYGNGSFSVNGSRGAAVPNTGTGGLSRYRYVEDEGGTTGYRNSGDANLGERRYVGINVTLYGKGEAVGMNRLNIDDYTGGTGYLGKDIMGSVRGITDDYGHLEERYEYDAFGKPYAGDLTQGMNLGYTGKPYDAVTGMYNYGYRDYQPETARFTTVDPIRDGANWFAYVNNDPVNWVDIFGLKATDQKDIVHSFQVGADMEGKQQFTDTMKSGINFNTLIEGIYDTVVGTGKVITGAGIIVASGAGEIFSGGTATPIAVGGLIFGGVTTVDGWVQASVGLAEIAGAFSNASTTNIPKSMSEIIGIVGDDIINFVTGKESKTFQNLGQWVGSQPVGVLDLLLKDTSPIY
jgi:RHS repeat-associated protein